MIMSAPVLGKKEGEMEDVLGRVARWALGHVHLLGCVAGGATACGASARGVKHVQPPGCVACGAMSGTQLSVAACAYSLIRLLRHGAYVCACVHSCRLLRREGHCDVLPARYAASTWRLPAQRKWGPTGGAANLLDTAVQPLMTFTVLTFSNLIPQLSK